MNAIFCVLVLFLSVSYTLEVSLLDIKPSVTILHGLEAPFDEKIEIGVRVRNLNLPMNEDRPFITEIAFLPFDVRNENNEESFVRIPLTLDTCIHRNRIAPRFSSRILDFTIVFHSTPDNGFKLNQQYSMAVHIHSHPLYVIPGVTITFGVHNERSRAFSTSHNSAFLETLNEVADFDVTRAQAAANPFEPGLHQQHQPRRRRQYTALLDNELPEDLVNHPQFTDVESESGFSWGVLFPHLTNPLSYSTSLEIDDPGVTTLKLKQSELKQHELDQICAICHDTAGERLDEDVIKTFCGCGRVQEIDENRQEWVRPCHYFHFGCLKPWLQMQNKICPQCRSKLNVDQLNLN